MCEFLNELHRETLLECPELRSIPQQLKGMKFIKLGKESKLPEKDEMWTNPKFQYSYGTLDLYEHLCGYGYNYGVFIGNEHIIIDIDDEDYIGIKDLLPITYTQKTSKGIHLFYKFDKLKRKAKLKWDGKNIGDLLTGNCYVLGALSIHPETKDFYSILENVEIASISLGELSTLKQFISNWDEIFEFENREVTSLTLDELRKKRSEDKSKKIERYYIDWGVSLISVDIESFQECKNYCFEKGRYYDCFLGRGKLYKSYNKEFDFIDNPVENILFIFSKSCIDNLLKVLTNDLKEQLLIVYKQSERTYYIEKLDSFESLIDFAQLNEEEITDIFKSKLIDSKKKGKKSSTKTLTNLYETAFNLYEKKGKIHPSLTDENCHYVFKEMVENNYSDEKIQEFSKSYTWKSGYDSLETQNQINYYRRKSSKNK